jgi:hypothetical protein
LTESNLLWQMNRTKRCAGGRRATLNRPYSKVKSTNQQRQKWKLFFHFRFSVITLSLLLQPSKSELASHTSSHFSLLQQHRKYNYTKLELFDLLTFELGLLYKIIAICCRSPFSLFCASTMRHRLILMSMPWEFS